MGLPFWMLEVEDIRLRYKQGAVPDQRDMRVVLSALDAANAKIKELQAENERLREIEERRSEGRRRLAEYEDSKPFAEWDK